MELSDRIKTIMDSEQLTPSAFADSLQIGRAVISHILNGRNNPSLDVVTRILSKYPHIAPEWLLQEKGSMYKDEESSSGYNPQPDLFSQNQENTTKVSETIKNRIFTEIKPTQNETLNTNNEQCTSTKVVDKKVVKIIIYYSDNTFEAFDTANKMI